MALGSTISQNFLRSVIQFDDDVFCDDVTLGKYLPDGGPLYTTLYNKNYEQSKPVLLLAQAALAEQYLGLPSAKEFSDHDEFKQIGDESSEITLKKLWEADRRLQSRGKPIELPEIFNESNKFHLMKIAVALDNAVRVSSLTADFSMHADKQTAEKYFNYVVKNVVDLQIAKSCRLDDDNLKSDKDNLNNAAVEIKNFAA